MADKMVIIPEAVYRHRGEDIERRKSVYPTLERIEDDIDYTLNNHNLTNYEKAKLLGQLQQRYKGIYASKEPIKIKVEESVPQQPTTSTNVFSQTINSLPKASKKKAAQILSTIKASNGALDWDTSQRIVIDGAPVANSNIVQLVKAYVSKSKKKTLPPAWEEFTEQMHNIKSPVAEYKKTRHTSYRRKTDAPLAGLQWQEEG